MSIGLSLSLLFHSVMYYSHSQQLRTSGEKPASNSNNERKRQREETVTSEEDSLKKRTLASWPFSSFSESSEYISEPQLRNVLLEHARHHADCGREEWIINARFGGGRQRRFGLFARFLSVAVPQEENCYDFDAPPTTFSVVNWALMDHRDHRYYRFSEVDPRAALLLCAMMKNGQAECTESGETEDSYITQAAVEQLSVNDLVRPDRLMAAAPTSSITELHLQYGRCSWKQIPPEDRGGSPTYVLHLAGRTNESDEANPEKEVDAVVDLVFKPRLAPILEGDHGMVSSNGRWEDDHSAYAIPHARLLSGSIHITRASDELEYFRDTHVKDGVIWAEHQFGGAVAHTAAEARVLKEVRRRRSSTSPQAAHERCYLRLTNGDSLSGSWLRDRTSGALLDATTIIQNAVTKRAVHHCGSDLRWATVAGKQFRSTETGSLFPTQWTLTTPRTGDGDILDLVISAAFEKQEFITCRAQPSRWEGSVVVTGVCKKADGSEEEVSGEGFVVSRGERLEATTVFGLLHNLMVGPVEGAEGSKAAQVSWEAVANGPAVGALSNLSVLWLMHGLTLTDAHQVVLQSMLGVYGYIFHHPTRDHLHQIEEALRWCYGKWVSFFGVRQVDYLTLVVRAFMLHELDAVIRSKCPSLLEQHRPGADAIDMMAPHLVTDIVNTDGCEFPSKALLQQPHSEAEFAQLQHLNGRWKLDPSKTRGHLAALLMMEGINMQTRTLLLHDQLHYVWDVEPSTEVVHLREITPIYHITRTILPDGADQRWRAVGLGEITYRSCLLSGGRKLYIESIIGLAVERRWYSISEDGQHLIEIMCLYPSAQTAAASATCQRYFSLVPNST